MPPNTILSIVLLMALYWAESESDDVFKDYLNQSCKINVEDNCECSKAIKDEYIHISSHFHVVNFMMHFSYTCHTSLNNHNINNSIIQIQTTAIADKVLIKCNHVYISSLLLNNLKQSLLFENFNTTVLVVKYCNISENLQKYLFNNRGNKLPLNLIEIEKTNLTKIENQTFQDLASLEWLSIRDNQIKFIYGGSFVGLSQLKIIDLSGNKLTTLPPNLFQENKMLTEINFNNNPIEIIPECLFSNLSKLFYLNLSNMKLKTIDNATFRGLSNLYKLDLSYNYLKDVNYMFESLRALDILNLSYNRIESISSIPYHLKYLFLDHNQMHTFDEAFLTLQTNVTLHDNPWDCHFIKSVQNHRNKKIHLSQAQTACAISKKTFITPKTEEASVIQLFNSNLHKEAIIVVNNGTSSTNQSNSSSVILMICSFSLFLLFVLIATISFCIYRFKRKPMQVEEEIYMPRLIVAAIPNSYTCEQLPSENTEIHDERDENIYETIDESPYNTYNQLQLD